MSDADRVDAMEGEAARLRREVAGLEATQRRLEATNRREMREWLSLAMAGPTACDTPMN